MSAEPEAMKVTDRRAVTTIPDRAIPPPPVVIPAGATPMDLLSQAVARGADLSYLQTLMDLQDRYEANNARKAFVAAMSAFKAEPIEILKSKFVNIPGGAKFKHATLADVVDAVLPAMGRHGLSHRWDVVQSPDLVTVTCIVTHEAGHSEKVTMSGPPDTSGKKNIIQEIASTVQYLQRYTLMAVVGVAAKDMDNDGAGGAPRHAEPEPDAPAGFANWKADMQIVADEGMARLTKSWNDSSQEFRRHVTQHDPSWWSEQKAKAVQADRKGAAK